MQGLPVEATIWYGNRHPLKISTPRGRAVGFLSYSTKEPPKFIG